MADDSFQEAKLIYDVLSQAGLKPEEETIAQLGDLLGLKTGVHDLHERVGRLTRGLPAEDEFMALATWMGGCSVIHKLDQTQFPSSSRQHIQVPDLFAVFSDGDHEIPALIEVKATNDEILPLARLRFTARAHAKLRSYADTLQLPLLIAWRVRGYWSLFDFSAIPPLQSAFAISGEDALKADLTYLLLGSLQFVPMEGVRLTLVLQYESLIEKKESGEEIRRMRFAGLRFEDSNGAKIQKLTRSQLILWMAAAHDEIQTKLDGGHEIAFQVPDEPPGIPAYTLLPFVMFGLRKEERRPASWWQALNDKKFNTVPYEAIVEGADQGIGTIIRYIFKMVPQEVPDFFPTKWPRLP